MSEEMSTPEVTPEVVTPEVNPEVEPTEITEPSEPEGLGEEQLSTLKELLPQYRETLKIGGEEKQLTYEELVQLAQKGGGAEKRFYEADQYKKEADAKIKYYQEFIESLKADPFSVIQQNPDLKGINVREHAENYLAQQLRQELMSDEERKAFHESQELEELRQHKQQWDQQQEAARARQAEDEAMTYYDDLFTKALTVAELPKNPHTIARMAAMTKTLASQGIEDVTHEELASLIREDYEKEQREYMRHLGPEKLQEYLGEEIIKELRKQIAGAVKNPEAHNNVQQLRTKGKTARSRPPQKNKSVTEWRREMEELRNSL